MTKEQKIEMLINLKNSNGAFTGYTSGFYECMDKAIQAIEKSEKYEKAIKDIRTEIKDIVAKEITEDEKWAIGLRHSLKVIDKYIGDTK